MPKAEHVPITATVLRWAINESGFGPVEIARRVKASPEDIEAWMLGSDTPTRGQFTLLTETLKRPSALFFLERVPAEPPTRVSLRAAFGDLKRNLTRDELNSIRYARGLQTLVRWSAQESGTHHEGLPTVTFETQPDSVSEAFRDRLGVKSFHQRSWSDANVAFLSWRQRLEALGVVVVQLDLGPTAIRGFSIASHETPLVAVNTSYSYQVRIFSLFHEVAHLLTNSSSACVGFAAPLRHVDRIERWCERFAASVLLPASAVKAFVSQFHPHHDEPGLDEVRAISRQFHVSARAAAMRLIDLELAPPSLYRAVDAHWQVLERTERRGGRAPSTPRRRLRQVGRRVANLVSQAVGRGAITQLDALRYLDLTLGEYEDFSELVAAEQ